MFTKYDISCHTVPSLPFIFLPKYFVYRNILHEYVEIRRTYGDEKDAVIRLNSGVKNIAKIIQNRYIKESNYGYSLNY